LRLAGQPPASCRQVVLWASSPYSALTTPPYLEDSHGEIAQSPHRGWRAEEQLRKAVKDIHFVRIGEDTGYLPSLNLDRYLDLLDWTGRQLAAGKRGRIPAELAPILTRLEIEVDRWLDAVVSFGRWFHRVAGAAQAMCAEAVRTSRRWLRGIAPARLVFGAK